MGKDAPWWAVPLAVLIGVPMYTNAAGIIPIVEALLGKGAALGTVLAFMMSVIALSLPEMIILRKVLKPRLIATFVGVVAAGILLVGYVFNVVLVSRGDSHEDIKVLGTGCANCKTTLKLIEEVAAGERACAVELEKVEDIRAIMSYGVMSTPGVVIDGKVVHAGGVPSRDKIAQWIAQA